MGRVVLVTGAAGTFGSRVTATLAADPSVERVVAVDLRTPDSDLGGADFIRVDIRNAIIGKVISDAGVDTVVHTGVISTPRQAGSRSLQKEINVIGTLQLMGACQAAPSVRRLVVRSSAAVYGSGPTDPALFRETDLPDSPPVGGWARDCTEVEGYVAAMARRRPDIGVVLLRFANAMGPTVDTTMTRYFQLPLLPVVLGRDPRLQFVHESDVVAALHRAATGGFTGTFNVAGPGVLTLLQAAALADRLVLPVPSTLFGTAHTLLRRGHLEFSAQDIDLLTYGRALDCSAAERRWGFVPRWTTRAAFESFLQGAPESEVPAAASLEADHG